MSANARTDVVVAYAHKTECLAGVLGQFVEFHALWDVVACDKLVGHGQILCNEFVDATLYFSDLLGGRALAEEEVDF